MFKSRESIGKEVAASQKMRHQIDKTEPKNCEDTEIFQNVKRNNLKFTKPTTFVNVLSKCFKATV